MNKILVPSRQPHRAGRACQAEEDPPWWAPCPATWTSPNRQRLIWPEQIPKDDWNKVFIVDARDADQFAKEHIPGAVNIEWRQAVVRRTELPKDRMVVMYCNSGSLSAQAVFALRLLGYDNVKVLQDGIEGWKAKGGFDAHARASKPAGH
jgi:rhodanese-related sulfurtransferase